MSNIEQLEERIAQLTELVKSGSEAIKSMEAALRTAEKERDKLADQRRKNEPKFEITQNEKYYFIDFRYKGCILDIKSDVYMDALIDKDRFAYNNCFKTEKRAKEVLDKINALLKLERLHDTYCPDYKPDWVRADDKHYALYDKQNNKYVCASTIGWSEATTVFFPTEEIAQKVCDILNKELNP